MAELSWQIWSMRRKWVIRRVMTCGRQVDLRYIFQQRMIVLCRVLCTSCPSKLLRAFFFFFLSSPPSLPNSRTSYDGSRNRNPSKIINLPNYRLFITTYTTLNHYGGWRFGWSFTTISAKPRNRTKHLSQISKTWSVSSHMPELFSLPLWRARAAEMRSSNYFSKFAMNYRATSTPFALTLIFFDIV